MKPRKNTRILRDPRVKDRRLLLNLEKIRISITGKSGYYRVMTTYKQKGAVAIQSLLNLESGGLATLYRHVSDLRELQNKLKTKLPSPVCDHFILANINEDTLTLHTDSSAWAARLRFLTPDILSAARQLCRLPPPQTIRIKVVPPTIETTTIKRSINLSSKNAQLILETANTIADPVLRAALTRLAQSKS